MNKPIPQVLIFVVDLIMGNFNCKQFAACNIDMSSPQCKCVYGDAFKLPRLTQEMRGSAFIGILITVGLYIGLMVLSGIMIYLYTMWVFMNQKIRDLYWRVHAAHDAFFMPEDLEVGLRSPYLSPFYFVFSIWLTIAFQFVSLFFGFRLVWRS